LVAVIDGLDSASSITVPGIPDVFDGKQVFSRISNYEGGVQDHINSQ